MANPGPARIVQQSLSAGMWRSVAPELIPANGVYDATNGLLDEDGDIYERGGTSYIELLAGDVGAGGATGVIVPNGDNAGWAPSAAPTAWQAVTDGNPATYAFASATGAAVDFDLANVTYGAGEGLATLAASYTPNHDSGVVVAIEIVDGGGTVLASSTGASVSYTWPTAIVAASANAVKVRLRVVTIWDGVTFARTDHVEATWTKGDTALPALPAADLAAEGTFLWHGWLTEGSRIVLATTADFWAIDDQNVAQNLGGDGMAHPGRSAVLDGIMYFPGGTTYDGGATLGTAAKVADFYAGVAGRLLAGKDDRVDFSPIKDPATFNADDFHKFPGGVKLLGLEGLRTSAVAFTTGGIWVIGNLDQNLTDDAGNVQQRLDHYSTDLVLWGDAGIAGWAGSLVVPGRDGIWLLSLGVESEAITAFERISTPIDDMYRSYVAQGCQPGGAQIQKGHYVLPILSGAAVVDELVCRIDRPARLAGGGRVYPWTHLRGYGAQVAALAVSRRTSDERLIAVGSRKLMEVHYFEPTAATALDADGSVPGLDLTTRAFPTGALNPNTVLKVKATYQMKRVDEDDDPTMQAYVGTGRDQGGLLTEQLVGDAPADEDATSPFSWPVVRKARYVQFRLVSSSAVAKLSLRLLEIFTRASGRID